MSTMTTNSLYLDEHLEEALQSIFSKDCPCSLTALKVLLNLHRELRFTGSELTIVKGPTVLLSIPLSSALKKFLQEQIVNKYKVKDIEKVKSYIRHNWSHFQPDGKKATLGKYYTQEHLVSLVKTEIAPLLLKHPETYIADLAAGCGAFLAAFEGHKLIGRDIDSEAVEVLLEMGFDANTVKVDNSLFNVSREKLGLHENAPLIIVGNPPYNDTSSKNKRYTTNKKSAGTLPCDLDIKSSDLGISFMRASAKLKPDHICILHPLSYLIKKANFSKLKDFSNNYQLISATVFSSSEFLLSGTPFPVVVALYSPGSMNYETIRNFHFSIYGSKQKLKLSKIQTTTGIIRQYPPTKGMVKTSDISLYQYNIRDINSLLTSGGLETLVNKNNLPIQFQTLGLYAYLNCMKRYFGKNFLFGNLPPIADPLDLTDTCFLDRCIIDTIIHNQRLMPFKRENKHSFVVDCHLPAQYRIKAKKNQIQRNPWQVNAYSLFGQFWQGQDCQTGVNLLGEEFKTYFSELRKSMLTP